MLKRTAAIVLAATFLSLAVAPETLAQRYRRAGDCRSTTTSYYNRGVAGTRYYSQPYYSGVSSRYYGQPYRSGVAGTRYYGSSYDRGYYGPYDRNRTRNLALTIGAPAAIGAGIGALAGGGKGAGIGALVGGGGGALFYLLNRRGRR